MIIRSKNFSIKLEEITKEETSLFLISETEKKVITLINKWLNGDKEFRFKTSGSTGMPKDILINRSKIEYSTHATFNSIDKKGSIRSSLLCLNPDFIGGAMVVFRALIKNLDLYIMEPTSNVLDELPASLQADLVSVVPLQLSSFKSEDITRFKNILIGGYHSHLSHLEDSTSNIYYTYGMTETVSHIALRKVNEEKYQCTGDCNVRLNSENKLEFKGEITDHKWLSTNDIGEVEDSTSFKWIGRGDFIINTGGIKVNPEHIEARLSKQIKSPFIISSLPDDRLGERVILVMEGEPDKPLDYSSLKKFEIPKEVYSNVMIIRTASGKIHRNQTRSNIINKFV